MCRFLGANTIWGKNNLIWSHIVLYICMLSKNAEQTLFLLFSETHHKVLSLKSPWALGENRVFTYQLWPHTLITPLKEQLTRSAAPGRSLFKVANLVSKQIWQRRPNVLFRECYQIRVVITDLAGRGVRSLSLAWSLSDSQRSQCF
jgi:hypothetical protein